MVWTNPVTFVANSALTAAQLNTFLRDNLNETEVAKATTAGSLFISTTDNAIAEGKVSGASVSTSQTTGSTSFTNLTTAGPSVTVTTRQYAIVIFSLLLRNDGTDFASANFYVSGATNLTHDPLSELTVWGANSHRTTSIAWMTTLVPGSNTFTLQYKVSAGTGTFSNRRLLVMCL